MAKRRKLWATSFRGLPDKRRHESKAEAYRYVNNDATNYAAGVRYRSAVVNVWVDEREGRGWELYETVDLAQLAGTGGRMMATAEQIRAAMLADGYTDPPAVGDEYVDPASVAWLPDGQSEVVTITGVWKLQAGWSTTVVRRRVDADGNTVPSGCGQGRIFVDMLLAEYRRVVSDG